MLDTGGGHAVTIGDIPSLERVQAHPNGKCRFKVRRVTVTAKSFRLNAVCSIPVTTRMQFVLLRARALGPILVTHQDIPWLASMAWPRPWALRVTACGDCTIGHAGQDGGHDRCRWDDLG